MNALANLGIGARSFYDEEVKAMFLAGGVANGRAYLDDDWFRYYPSGRVEVHELCGGCEEDGSCPFHPPGCECSDGWCPGGWRGEETAAASYEDEWDEEEAREQEHERALQERAQSFGARWNRQRVDVDAAALWLWQHGAA